MILYAPQNPVAFNILGFDVRWYGLIMTCAIFVGIFLGYQIIKRKFSQNEANIFIDIAPYVVILSIIGARLFYVIGAFGYYMEHPLDIIMLNHGGLSLWGSVLFGILSIYFISIKYKFNFLKYLDVFSLVMPLCQSIGRWGNFINQEAYGKPTNSFIMLFVEPKYRQGNLMDVEYYHPAFLYESILDFCLFLILFFVFLKFKDLKYGYMTSFYLVSYGSIRLITESIRQDSILNVFNMPIATILSIVCIIFGICLFFNSKFNH
ncbi:prolipoprotein diacylglyceryl transferase [bacterium]|nr:prolipoprotein diacylglyceryl transferase [bacterium]